MESITANNVESFKDIANFLADLIPGGIIFAVCDLEKLLWKKASKAFDIPAFHVGLQNRKGGAADQCMKNRRPVQEQVPRAVYGMRFIMQAIPIMENNQSSGAVMVMLPKMIPVARAFPDFAPIIANMFPEGSHMYMTDLEKYVYSQPSSKFSLPGIEAGSHFKPESIAAQAIRNKTAIDKEVDASLYGVPVRISNHPLFDDEGTNAVVATIGIITPKANAVHLRQVADSLTRSLEEVSAVIEELAASAGEINVNEQNLNSRIKGVNQLADEITEVLSFIKQVADETKMLGINAAIEAARVGEAGRGFGVVAEEIRKLSNESKNTVVSIRSLIERIKIEVKETLDGSQLTTNASQEQAAATQEITASIEEITSLSDELAKMALNM
ncbi:MAG: methyl-accepting chemotaxis protein [Syntrophomonas sp.]